MLGLFGAITTTLSLSHSLPSSPQQVRRLFLKLNTPHPNLLCVYILVLSVLTLVQSALPGANLWTHITFSFAVPYWSLSISINILLTLLIVIRLVTIRNRLRAALGVQHAQTYTSLIAVIVESASIYSTLGLIYIVAFARNWNVQNLILPVLGQVMVRIVPHHLCLPSLSHHSLLTSHHISLSLSP